MRVVRTYVERTSLRMRWIATEGKRLISGLDDQSSFPRSYVSPSNVLPFPLAFSSLCPNHVHVYAMVSPRQRQRPGMHQRATQRVTYVFVKPCSSVHHGFTEAGTASGSATTRNAIYTNTTTSILLPFLSFTSMRIRNIRTYVQALLRSLLFLQLWPWALRGAAATTALHAATGALQQGG